MYRRWCEEGLAAEGSAPLSLTARLSGEIAAMKELDLDGVLVRWRKLFRSMPSHLQVPTVQGAGVSHPGKCAR